MIYGPWLRNQYTSLLLHSTSLDLKCEWKWNDLQLFFSTEYSLQKGLHAKYLCSVNKYTPNLINTSYLFQTACQYSCYLMSYLLLSEQLFRENLLSSLQLASNCDWNCLSLYCSMASGNQSISIHYLCCFADYQMSSLYYLYYPYDIKEHKDNSEPNTQINFILSYLSAKENLNKIN